MSEENIQSIYLSINAAEKKAADARTKLLNLKSTLQTAINEIETSLEVSYTKWMILLKKTAEGWECLAIVDQDNPPEEEIHWDLSLPIPDPQTVPEFDGW